jgi:hypothetical protein
MTTPLLMRVSFLLATIASISSAFTITTNLPFPTRSVNPRSTCLFVEESSSSLENPKIPVDNTAAAAAAAVTTTTNTTTNATTAATTSNDAEDAAPRFMMNLLQLAATTGRGEFASKIQHDTAASYIASLEQLNPTSNPTSSVSIQGTWELVYSNTQLFRSSPFFMAGRAVCTTPEQAQQYDWFCDMHRKALAISSIRAVRQIISNTRLLSEFEVQAGAVPFLRDLTPLAYSGGWPVTIQGAIVSSADITSTNDGTAWELYMDTVEIKGSNLPGLRQLLDQGQIKLQSRTLGDFLETNVDGYANPRPIFYTTYLSDSTRISRDQDGKVFVYTKVSDRMEPTNYSNVLPDLGVARLLEGFNDAITKFYI